MDETRRVNPLISSFHFMRFFLAPTICLAWVIQNACSLKHNKPPRTRTRTQAQAHELGMLLPLGAHPLPTTTDGHL
jgi:hypothetical protein